MASRYEEWAGRPVNRDELGQFASTAMGSWVQAAVEQMDRIGKFAKPEVAHRSGERPPGYFAAVRHAGNLWAIAEKRERTDDEQAELEDLEERFARYRESIGLKPAWEGTQAFYSFTGRRDDPEVYDSYGRRVPKGVLRGWKRVADNPYDRVGTGWMSDIFGDERDHPMAGGLWINPQNPGTKHNPELLSDRGHVESRAMKDISRSERHKRGWLERVANFPKDETGDQIPMITRRASTDDRWEGPIGSRGEAERDWRTFASPLTRKRVRQAKIGNRQRRTWIERVNTQIERGEA